MASSTHEEHRKYVGPPERYDLAASGQFSLLTLLGMREDQSLLDIGCGSLRGGRLALMYLKPGLYYGMEPNQWLIDDGIAKEIGKDLIALKRPTFSNDGNFTLTTFGRQFDFMVAQSIFSHATQAQIRRCLSEAKKALAPAGIFACTYFPGEENYTGEEWVYPGCVTYTLEHMTMLAREAGLACKPINWTHSNQQKWVSMTHLDSGVEVPQLSDPSRIAILEHSLAETKEKLGRLERLGGIRFLKKVNRAIYGKPKKK